MKVSGYQAVDDAHAQAVRSGRGVEVPGNGLAIVGDLDDGVSLVFASVKLKPCVVRLAKPCLTALATSSLMRRARMVACFECTRTSVDGISNVTVRPGGMRGAVGLVGRVTSEDVDCRTTSLRSSLRRSWTAAIAWTRLMASRRWLAQGAFLIVAQLDGQQGRRLFAVVADAMMHLLQQC